MKARKVHGSPDAQRRDERAWKTVGLIKLKNATAVATATQVSHKDLAATISGMDSPGRLGVQDSGQAQTAVRYNRDQAAEQSFYAPKKNGGAPP